MQPIEQDAAELWNAYRAGHSITARNLLIERFLPLARMHAGRIAHRLPPRIAYAEVLSAGCDGLIQAVETFDPTRGVKFLTFAYARIGGSITDWLRSIDRRSRGLAAFERRRMLHESMYFASAGRPPTDAEIAASMDLALATFLRLRRQARHARERRLSALSDVGADRRRLPDDCSIQIEHGDAARLAAHELLETGRGLSRREHAILIGCYRQGRTLDSVARDLRLTKQRVSQIRRRLLVRLAVCLTSPRPDQSSPPAADAQPVDARLADRRRPDRRQLDARSIAYRSAIDAPAKPPRGNCERPATRRRPVRPAPVRPSKDTRVPTSSNNFRHRKLVSEMKICLAAVRAPPRFRPRQGRFFRV